MADTKPENQPDPTSEEGISEDDLRKLIGEELDSRLSSLTDSLGGITDGIVEKLKGETSGNAVSEESLLEKIGGMIDEKLKGISTNGKQKGPREPKLRIFT